MPSRTGKVEGILMKKILILAVPFMLAGCSYYNQFVERMNTDTLEYQCEQKPLTVHLNNTRQQVSFIYDNQQLTVFQHNTVAFINGGAIAFRPEDVYAIGIARAGGGETLL